MKNDSLVLKNGRLEKMEGIACIEDKWLFKNSDPQIYIEFENKIQGIRLVCDWGEGDINKGNSTVYYRYGNEGYSEEKTCIIPFLSERKIVREIWFEMPIQGIRFDPIDSDGECVVKQLLIEKIEKTEILKGEGFFEINEQDLNKEKVVVLSHELSKSGAPILAYHIAKELKNAGKNVIVLSGHAGNGYLEKKYLEKEIPVMNIGDFQEREYDYIYVSDKTYYLEPLKYRKMVVKLLRRRGFSVVITNSIVSGQFVDVFKNYNFKVISLIHEMKATIEFYGFKKYGEKIACFSDYIVFPNEIVENDFKHLFSNINGKCLIQGQGVYLDSIDKSICLNSNISKIKSDDVIIMSSGRCELRKGVDLFVDAAIMLCNKNLKRNIYFVWTGDFTNFELECWVKNQIERSGYVERIFFIPFIEDVEKYRSFLKRANIFWAMSREDPFPSTVLEAMKNKVPVVGFSGTGGIQVMLSEDRGILVDSFDLEKYVDASIKIIDAKDKYIKMIESAAQYTNELKFEKYVDFLLSCIESQYVIEPKLDLYKWEASKHFYEQQLTIKTFEEKKRELIRVSLLKKFFPVEIDKSKVILLDTAQGSDNVGDEIIMDYCTMACTKALPKACFENIPTHIYDPRSEKVDRYFKILCGTNLIYKQMENSKQWALPMDINNYKNICLLGVGMQQLGINLPISNYTKWFLHFILDSKCIHSVRDEQTKQCLNKIGIKNVLNTGCPTMWGLTPDHCAKIPTKKADNVLSTVTDYMVDREKDIYMLSILKKHYKNVYIWIQVQRDYEYLCEIIDLEDYIIIPPSLQELDKVLETKKLDYIGTRLYAGIRCLNYLHRACIVAVDNRARAISRDTNLTIIEREELENELEKWIYGNCEIAIKMPIQAIEQWKNQFSDVL